MIGLVGLPSQGASEPLCLTYLLEPVCLGDPTRGTEPKQHGSMIIEPLKPLHHEEMAVRGGGCGTIMFQLPTKAQTYMAIVVKEINISINVFIAVCIFILLEMCFS